MIPAKYPSVGSALPLLPEGHEQCPHSVEDIDRLSIVLLGPQAFGKNTFYFLWHRGWLAMSEAISLPLRAPEQLKPTLYNATTNEALALRLRALISGLKGTAPSPDAPVLVPTAGAVLNKNNSDADMNKNNENKQSHSHNLITPPNGTYTPEIGIASPTVSIKNPTTATLSGGSSQDLDQQEKHHGEEKQQQQQQQQELLRAVPVATVTVTITDSDSQHPILTSRLATIEAAGVSLGGRTATEGGPSKYRGVVWHKSNSKWEARIYEAGKQRFLGYFSNEDEAALVYDDYAARIHGTSAKLNFPETYAGVVLPKPTHAVHAVRHARQHSPGPRAVAPGTSRPRIPTTTAAVVQALSSERDGVTHDTLAPSSQGHLPHPHPPRRHVTNANGGTRVQPVKGSSSFRGVSWNSNCSKWRAQVWKGSEVHHLGYFGHEEDAAHAYDEAVLRIRGPDAPTNYPRSQYGVYSEDDEEMHHATTTSNSGQFGVHSSSHRTAAKSAAAAAVITIDKKEDATTSNDGDSHMLGVSWSEYHSAWIAEIWDGKKYQLLGAFHTEADAAKAYDVACLAQQGSDALTNFSLENYPTESAAVALLGLAHDYEGYEELYGSGSEAEQVVGKKRRRKRSATPTLQPSSTSQLPLNHQEQYHSSSDLNALNNNANNDGSTHPAKKQTLAIHNKKSNDGDGDGATRAVTPLVESKNEDDGGSLSFPTVVPPQQYQYSAGVNAVGEVWAPRSVAIATAPITVAAAPTAAPAVPVVRGEEYNILVGQLQNFIAQQQQQQQRQFLPVLPLQSSAPRQEERPTVLSSQAQTALNIIMQAAFARQQESAAAAAAAAAAQASWQEQYAAHHQRLALAAAVQKWALAKQQQQQQQQHGVVSAPATAPLNRNLPSNFSSEYNTNSNPAAMAAYRALLSHQMNAAAKASRV